MVVVIVPTGVDIAIGTISFETLTLGEARCAKIARRNYTTRFCYWRFLFKPTPSIIPPVYLKLLEIIPSHFKGLTLFLLRKLLAPFL